MAQGKQRQYYYFMEKPIDTESIILFDVEEKLYDEALELINSIQHDLGPKLIVAKAKCLIGVGRDEEALDILINAEKQDWDLPQILMLKGYALFKLEEYHTAKMAFERCLEIKPSQEIKRWIQRCDVYLSMNNEEVSRRCIRYEPQLTHCPPSQINPQLQQQFQQFFQLSPIDLQGEIKTPKPENPQSNEKPTQTQVRPHYEWYQSSTHATMELYIRDLKESDVDVKFNESSFDIKINADPKIEMHVDLVKNIVPSLSTISVTPKKIEIKMKKQVESKWSSFEQHP